MTSTFSLGQVIEFKPQARELRPKKVITPTEQYYPTLWQCFVVSTTIGILLFPAYKSTDFEVHRNWLAITHSLPPWQWYYENSSEWTLDYPPFFAAFEWLLSQPAALLDSGMVTVTNLEYSNWATVSFQRTTVLISDLSLLGSLYHFVANTPAISKRQSHAIALSLLLSPGFFIIDHIHFQYNAMMYGILILSISYARKDGGLLKSGILFAILLCFKHIYLYLAPAYFVYLLRTYCLARTSVFRPRVFNAIKLGAGLAIVFGTAFGPFVYWGQLEQLKARLFPFARGLCHAYWAPNIWALYSLVDRALIALSAQFKLNVDPSALKSVTRGLVGDTAFAVLPEVTPQICFALTLACQTLALVKLWAKPTWDTFVGALTLCGYASFLFGWHVHEKAVLLIIVPFSLIALRDRSYLASYRPLVVAGYLSLFPLLYNTREFPIKVLYTVGYLIVFMYAFDRLAPAPERRRVFLLDRFALLYNTFSVPLLLYTSVVHETVFRGQYEFLPLMLTSVYCAVGVVISWLGFSVCYLAS